MTTALFIVGLLTSIGCGTNVVATSKASWQHELIWMIGGLAGAGIMILAIWLGRAA